MKQLKSIPVADNLLEEQAHGSFGFPLAVYLDDLDAYDLGHVPWHWHPELEFGVMLKGEAEIQVADARFPLRAGEGFFINANVLHAQHPLKPGSVFFSVVFSPRLLGHMGSSVQAQYVAPVLECAALKSLRLRPTVAWQGEIIRHLTSLRDCCAHGRYRHELAATATLLQLWQVLHTGCAPYLAKPEASATTRDEVRIKCMLDFIHSHYREALFLDDIAASASLSASECCRCFQRVLGTTPFGYLNQHRLVQAAALLRQGHSATEVYAQTGHCSQSYFGKQFKALFGCTPGQYKKASSME